MHTFNGRQVKATLVDDLVWELQTICEARGLHFVGTSEGCEVETTDDQVFSWDAVDKFKCELQSYTDHHLQVNGESDSGNYSPSRYMANLRRAIKMLSSTDDLFVPCSEINCDYCFEVH
jgi:hypothetical protein